MSDDIVTGGIIPEEEGELDPDAIEEDDVIEEVDEVDLFEEEVPLASLVSDDDDEDDDIFGDDE